MGEARQDPMVEKMRELDLKEKKKILVCGGGSGAHALAAISAHDGFEVKVLTILGDEAELWTKALQENKGKTKAVFLESCFAHTTCEKCKQKFNKTCMVCKERFDSRSKLFKHLWKEEHAKDLEMEGEILTVTKEAGDVVPWADVIILCAPAFAHRELLTAIAPHLKKMTTKEDVKNGHIIGAFPGCGGFELEVKDVLGADVTKKCSIFSGVTLPWLCRVHDDYYGRSVNIRGFKSYFQVAVEPCETALTDISKEIDALRDLLQTMIGSFPIVDVGVNMMEGELVSLQSMTSMWNPVIVYGAFKDWDGKMAFEERPLFYEGVNSWTAEKISKCSDELMKIKKALEKRGMKIDGVCHVKDWVKKAYAGQIKDTSTLQSCIATNRSYEGIEHEMEVLKPSIKEGTRYVPDFQVRALTQDIPYGMLFNRAVAELVGVETPNTDEVIMWAQAKTEMKKNAYLVEKNGKTVLQMHALKGTRAPQAYGVTTVEKLMEVYGRTATGGVTCG